MKRITSILIVIVLLLGLSACTETIETRKKEYLTEFEERITIECTMVESLNDPLIRYSFSSNKIETETFFYEKNPYQKLNLDMIMESELTSIGMSETLRIYEFREKYICVFDNKWEILSTDYSLNDYISDKKYKDVDAMNRISEIFISIAKIGRVDMIQQFSEILIYQYDPIVTELANRWVQNNFTDAEVEINNRNNFNLDDLSKWAEYYLSYCIE